MPAFDEKHPLSNLPSARVFLTYLKANPDQAKRLRLSAVSLFGQIKLMKLPFNQDCVELVEKALQIQQENEHSTETKQRFAALSKLTDYQQALTPQEQEEEQRQVDALDEAIKDMGVIDFIGGNPNKAAEKLEASFTKKASMSSQGLGKETQKALADYIGRHHLETLATIASEAAGDALLDDEARDWIAQTVEAVNECDGDKRKILNASYALLVDEMNTYTSFIVRDHLAGFLKSELDWESRPREVTSADIQNLFKNQHN